MNPRVPVLHVQLDMLRQQIITIQSQLDAAKAFAGPSDPAWLLRANHALRAKGLKIQSIQQELGRINREEARKSQTALEACFVNAARLTLSLEVFQYIMDRAKEMQEENKHGRPAN